eukprot:CAMPEP_0169474216 /NCGR_PEP_ID=MMETSP1042-20121227/26139_1 /TAXON_ID=464988 /ORGANISM="Hemiselmis andersenii, Strain CCMP1180" /LENGTH=75 /DNA_ID=CAMNT_0009588233 /DNA_START=66 /DNA_END=290 /DNA_ORIENTATION=+
MSCFVWHTRPLFFPGSESLAGRGLALGALVLMPLRCRWHVEIRVEIQAPDGAQGTTGGLDPDFPAYAKHLRRIRV